MAVAARRHPPGASPHRRRYPIGAEIGPAGVSFRVWAPLAERVAVVTSRGDAVDLVAERDGYHRGVLADAGAGLRYAFRLDGGDPLPDPASRFQPEGPEGWSEVIDATPFCWSDAAWKGPRGEREVIYEIHVGTFTAEGSWEAATERLPELADLGVTMIEVMPVAEFAGGFGWGYDGVLWFAPFHRYGRPDAMRGFVDRAHATGLAVILDVVYNHLGPRGNVLPRFSSTYAGDHGTDWGDGMNFDGEGSGPVRELVTTNARVWIEEYHLDGLRLDATQDLHDASPEPIVAAVARSAREAAGERRIFLVAENEPQDARLARPVARGGCGLDAIWNDDFHHAARVAATGRTEAYYSPYRGTPQELVSALAHGFLYQGQHYAWQEAGRGTSAWDLPPAAFVHYLENHDQVANSARGERLHRLAAPGVWRALTATLLLSPQHVLLFQGQEVASSRPFAYFADHPGELGRSVREGRLEFLAQFPSLAGEAARAAVPDPTAAATFEACKLDPEDRARHREVLRLTRDLLRLRRYDPGVSGPYRRPLLGAVLGREAFVVRVFGMATERLLVVNLGPDLYLEAAPEPLLAPLPDAPWRVLWSSEEPCYGGGGTPEIEDLGRARLPARSALLFAPAR